MKSFRVQPADAIGGALGDAVGDATGAIADATGAISSAMHAWTPATFSPPLLGLRAERAVDYVGEKASMFSFFTNFYTIILRKRGSALPKIMIEIFLATCLGVVAYLLTEDGICGKHGAVKCKGFFLPPSTSREKGHAMIGVLLAFLVVFRSQIAWGMYMEGRNGVGAVVRDIRFLALEVLSSLAHAAVEDTQVDGADGSSTLVNVLGASADSLLDEVTDGAASQPSLTTMNGKGFTASLFSAGPPLRRASASAPADMGGAATRSEAGHSKVQLPKNGKQVKPLRLTDRLRYAQEVQVRRE